MLRGLVCRCAMDTDLLHVPLPWLHSGALNRPKEAAGPWIPRVVLSQQRNEKLNERDCHQASSHGTEERAAFILNGPAAGTSSALWAGKLPPPLPSSHSWSEGCRSHCCGPCGLIPVAPWHGGVGRFPQSPPVLLIVLL